MTQAQKTAKAKFKQAIAYRQKTGVSLKEAFAHIYGKKKVVAVKKKAAPKKKAAKKVIKGIYDNEKAYRELASNNYYSKKVVKKKSAPKKKVAKKKLTRIDYDKRFQAKKPGKRKSASGNTYYENRENRSDKGKLLGIGQLTKIIGSVSGKYYIEYMSENGYKKMEFFNKFPKGYYKGMDRIIYVTRLSNGGTALIPLKYSDNNKDVKK